MREFRHIVRFVEFCRIHLVNVFSIDLSLLQLFNGVSAGRQGDVTYATIVALYDYSAPFQFLDDPSSHKGQFRIFQPYVSLSREVIFTLKPSNLIVFALQRFGLDKRRGKCIGSWVTVPV